MPEMANLGKAFNTLSVYSNSRLGHPLAQECERRSDCDIRPPTTCRRPTLRQEPDCASVWSPHILAVDPTVHLSKRPIRAGINPDSSLPPILVAGESIDPIPALSNPQAKHLDQFLKFPISSAPIPVRVLSGRADQVVATPAQVSGWGFIERRSLLATAIEHTQILGCSSRESPNERPKRRSTLHAETKVAPVVRTSSTSTQTRGSPSAPDLRRLPFRRSIRNPSRIFRARAVDESPICSGR